MTMLIVGLDKMPSPDAEMTKLDKELNAAIREMIESKSHLHAHTHMHSPFCFITLLESLIYSLIFVIFYKIFVSL